MKIAPIFVKTQEQIELYSIIQQGKRLITPNATMIHWKSHRACILLTKCIMKVKRRGHRFVIAFGSLTLIVMLSLLIFSVAKVTDGPDTSKRIENGSFKPNVWKPEWVDRDNNGIADGLDHEIADRPSNRAAQEYVNVTVMLKTEPTVHDADVFVSSGGYLTTSPWTQAIYGFGGRIPYSGIDVFAEQCPDVLLVEKEAVCQCEFGLRCKAGGRQTLRVEHSGASGRPEFVNCDFGHWDRRLSPGLFAWIWRSELLRKIVGWNDQISATTTPFDDNGHGSHVSGLAAGDGFFSVDASGNATATWGANLGSVSCRHVLHKRHDGEQNRYHNHKSEMGRPLAQPSFQRFHSTMATKP